MGKSRRLYKTNKYVSYKFVKLLKNSETEDKKNEHHFRSWNGDKYNITQKTICDCVPACDASDKLSVSNVVQTHVWSAARSLWRRLLCPCILAWVRTLCLQISHQPCPEIDLHAMMQIHVTWLPFPFIYIRSYICTCSRIARPVNHLVQVAAFLIQSRFWFEMMVVVFCWIRQPDSKTKSWPLRLVCPEIMTACHRLGVPQRRYKIGVN